MAAQSQLIQFHVRQKSCFFRQFFAENCFSRPNCSVLTIQCYTSLESSGHKLSHGIFKENISWIPQSVRFLLTPWDILITSFSNLILCQFVESLNFNPFFYCIPYLNCSGQLSPALIEVEKGIVRSCSIRLITCLYPYSLLSSCNEGLRE